MKSMGQIMEELGFNKGASGASKKAFIKYLIQADPKSSLKAPVLPLKKAMKIQMSFEDYLSAVEETEKEVS